MASARREADWDVTSALMALIANVKRRPDRPAFRAEQFHPMRRPPRRSIAEHIRELGPKDPIAYQPVSTLVTPAAQQN